MNGFFGDQLSLDTSQQRQQQQAQQNIVNGEGNDATMMNIDDRSFGGNMFGQDTHAQGMSGRRHSLPYAQQSFSPNSAAQARMSMSSAAFRALGADGGMPILDFTSTAPPVGSSGEIHSAVENAFKNFSFGTADGAMNFPMSTMPSQATSLPQTTMEQQQSSAGPQAVSGFSSASNTLSSGSTDANAFSGLSQGMIDDMMSYSVLDMSQINGTQPSSLDAASLAFFSTAGPDTGITQPSTMGFLAGQPDALSTLTFSQSVDIAAGVPLDAASGTLNMGIPSSLQQQQQAGQAHMDLFSAPSQSSHPTPGSSASLGRSHISPLTQQQGQFPGGLGQSMSGTPSLNEAQSNLSGPPLSASNSAGITPNSIGRASSTSASASSIPTPAQISSGGAPSTRIGTVVSCPMPPAPPPINTKTIKNYYSSSHFDMIRALYYVSSRPNPEISIGPVDLSCAFVVCDATLNDCPIIYISDNFQHLTGYSNHEILGQNCRFLQAPDGRVEAGSRREFTDNKAVMNIKEKLLAGREVQQSLINYRKGGKPFLNLLTMIPIPWDDYKEGFKYFIGLQIDLVESPDAISGNSGDSMRIDYKHRTSIPQHIWDPPKTAQWSTNQGRTLGMDDVSALLQQFGNKGLMSSKGVGSDIVNSATSDLYRQSWDKMLLENVDDVIHVLSLKGVFLYLSPSCKEILEYDASDLMGSSLSSICHPSDIVPVTREMRDTQADQPINFVYRIRRKRSGYTWFESHGSLLVEQGKGRKCIVLIGRKRPAFALRRCDVDINGGIGDSEIWTKLSTSGMILHVSSNVRSLLDVQPDTLVGTSIQDLMRKESRAGFNRSLEKVRRGIIASCRHEVQHRRGQVLQSSTILYPGDAERGEKPTFILGQTRLLKFSSSRNSNQHSTTTGTSSTSGIATGEVDEIGRAGALGQLAEPDSQTGGFVSSAGGGAIPLGSQDAILAADDNIFGELKTTRCTSWQYELRQMEKANRLLAEELGQLLANRKKRKRRKGVGNVPRDCANCHTRNTPEWRRGPSGQRDLCNSCGLRWAKQVGRVSPRNSSRGGGSTTIAGGGGNAATDALSKKSASPIHASPLQRDFPANVVSNNTSAGESSSSNHSPVTGNGNGNGNTSGGDSFAVASNSHDSMPPSTGTEMTSIQEEREASL
ncbi:blue light receptor [Sporothrix eucalyptigena]|uniref:Blue light receptor n=1 Tax=Sporothrix eucalyptigena TaxID=1812306 RepID=A0ABP0BPX1_9PEZI